MAVKIYADDLRLQERDQYFASEFAESAAQKTALIACANSQEIMQAINANVPMVIAIWIGDKLCRVKVKRAKRRRNFLQTTTRDFSIAWQLAVNSYD
jgi:hypothetical protein